MLSLSDIQSYKYKNLRGNTEALGLNFLKNQPPIIQLEDTLTNAKIQKICNKIINAINFVSSNGGFIDVYPEEITHTSMSQSFVDKRILFFALEVLKNLRGIEVTVSTDIPFRLTLKKGLNHLIHYSNRSEQKAELIKSLDGRLALATYENDEELLGIFFRLGANFDFSDILGRNCAYFSNNKKIFELVTKYGANPSIKDALDFTPNRFISQCTQVDVPPIARLPKELFYFICGKCSPRLLLSLSRVCKLWEAFLNQPDIWKMKCLELYKKPSDDVPNWKSFLKQKMYESMLERMNKQTCLLTPVAFESPIRKFKLIGEYIYSSHEDGTIRRWDTVPDSVKCTTIFPGWGKPLTAFEVSGNYIYAASEKFLTTWNIKYQRVEHMSDVYERIRQILVSSSSLFVKCKKSVTQLNLKTHETINVVYTSAEKFGSTIIKEPYLFLGQKFVKEIMKWDFSTNKVSFWDASIINQWAIEDNAVDKVILLNENIYTCHRTGRIKKWTLNGERLATIDLSINILDIQSLISLSKRICAFTSDYKRYDFDDSKDDPKGFEHSLTQVKSGGRIRSVIWKEGRAYVLARDNVVTVYDYAADQKAITLQIGKALKESPSGSFLYEQALKRYNALPVSEENKIADCLHF